MNSIFVLGNIITILVTLPVFKTLRISVYEREDEYLEFEDLKQKIIDDYNFDESLLREFVLNRDEMYEFVQYFNRTGEIPEWSKSHKLKNPDAYEKLRFYSYISSPLSTDDIMRSLINFKDVLFPNSPDVSFEDIQRDYVERNLNELISVENYLAIRIMEKNFKQVELENPIGWRMRIALYSLAIRQYSERSTHSQRKLVCDSKRLKPESDIDGYEVGEIFKLNSFRLCRSKRLFPEKPSESSSVNVNNPSSHWTIYKHIITDPKFVVYLKDVIKRNDERLYFLLPQTFFKVVESSFHNTVGGKVDYLKVKTVRNLKISECLANAANMIETYKVKEILHGLP